MRRVLSVVFERTVPWAVLGLLLSFTYAHLLLMPYLGFKFLPSTGEIVFVFVDNPSGPNLQAGDHLVQIGAVSWQAYICDHRQPILEEQTTGETLEIQVQRAGKLLVIPWMMPGGNAQEIADRLIDIWWLAYLFWLAGTATVLLVRPKDTRWRLLIAFYYLTAVWLAAGNTSQWHLWQSAIVLRMAIWLAVPVYLHLHWFFPHPLRQVRALFWGGLYLMAGLLAGLEWFQTLPRNTYLLGLMVAFFGSLVLLTVHFVIQPRERRAIRPLLLAMATVVLPLIGVSIIELIHGLPLSGYAVLLGLPLIPGAYFYTTYRHQLGGLELRANRVIALYSFLVLLAVITLLIISILSLWFEMAIPTLIVSVVATLLAAVVSALWLTPYQRFIEHRLLDIPLPPAHLLETYTARIATSLEMDNLIRLLRDVVLPSLMVRQSALLRLHARHGQALVYGDQVPDDQLPDQHQIAELLATAGKSRAPAPPDAPQRGCPWVRLVLPLTVDHELIGLWLFGKRDPDDFYSQSELVTFQALADQTALTLINIDQAEQLRTLYLVNIDRAEMERTELARVLHDEVLNLFPVLLLRSNNSTSAPQIEQTYQELTNRIRQIITDLRPVLLTYSLGSALTELVDSLVERAGAQITFHIDLAQTAARYPPRVEQYLFRIVQQACENALRHAQASTIRIYGALDADHVLINVADDGIGFEAGDRLDLATLLASRHFGLVGMFERAAIIGARLQIESAPGQGAQVHLTWQPAATVSARSHHLDQPRDDRDLSKAQETVRPLEPYMNVM